MKNVITIIFAVGALMLNGCSDGQRNISEKSAIQSVFAQRDKIKKAELDFLSDQRIADLMAIDVRDCPADFRSVWFDYLVETDNLHVKIKRAVLIAAEERKSITDLPSLIKFSAGTPPLGQYLLNELNNVDAAWTKVERTAMNYGVMPQLQTSEETKVISEKR